MLKLGCTLPNMTKICLQRSTDSNVYPFSETGKDLLEIIRADKFGGPSIVFTRKAVVNETFIRKSTNLLLELMPISFILTQCVNQYQVVCIQDGSIRVRPSASHHAKTDRVLSTKWPCLIFNYFDRTVILRVTLLLVGKIKLIVSVLRV